MRLTIWRGPPGRDYAGSCATLARMSAAGAPGWRASLVHDGGETGIWTVRAVPFFTQYAAPEVIGRVLAWADQRGIPVVRQDASPVKGVITNDRLRALGGWMRSQDHARDALRHLLYREHRLGLLALPPKE